MAHAIRENFPAAFLLQTRVRKQPAVTFLLPWGLRLRPQGFPGAVLPYKMRFLFWWDRMTLSPASLIITPQHVVAAHLPAVCWSSSVMAGPSKLKAMRNQPFLAAARALQARRLCSLFM